MNVPSRDLVEREPWPRQVLAVEPAAQAGPQGKQFGFTELVRMLRRRKFLIIFTIMGVLAATFAMLKMMEPVYSSTAVVMVESETPDDGTGSAVKTVALAPNDELRIATKMELLQSRSLARKVAGKLGLERDPEFAEKDREPGPVSRILGLFMAPEPEVGPQTPAQKEAARVAEIEAVTDRLINHVTVERVAKSNLIRVVADSNDPDKAALIANSYVDTHIASQLASEREANEKELAQLTKRVAALREDLRFADSAVARYREANGFITARPDGLNQAQMAQLSGALAQARAQRAQTGSRASLFSGPRGDGATSALLNDLRGQQATLDKRLAELSVLYGPNHPDVRNTKAQLTAIGARINEEIGRVGTGLRNEAAVSQAEEGQLARDVRALKSQSFQEIAATPALLDLERDAETGQTLYVSLLSRLKDISGKGNDSHVDTSIVSRAPVPVEPSHPAPKQTLAAAFVGSLALAFILAIIAETRDNRMRTAEQVERWLNVPALSLIPEVRNPPESDRLYDVLSLQPRSAFSEAIRTLLIELQPEAPSSGGHVVLVTSPLGGEGKRTIATSLAAAAASAGRSAVMVDLDLRKFDRVHHADPAGVADIQAYLMARVELDQVIAFDEAFAPFAIVTALGPARDPGSLIASPRLALLIAQLRERFDFIVLNAPPVLPVRDAKIIAKLADSTLLILRWGATSFEAARIAITILEGKVAGAVLNRVDYRRHKNHGNADPIHHMASLDRYYREAAEIEEEEEARPRLRLGNWKP